MMERGGERELLGNKRRETASKVGRANIPLSHYVLPPACVITSPKPSRVVLVGERVIKLETDRTDHPGTQPADRNKSRTVKTVVFRLA